MPLPVQTYRDLLKKNYTTGTVGPKNTHPIPIKDRIVVKLINNFKKLNYELAQLVGFPEHF